MSWMKAIEFDKEGKPTAYELYHCTGDRKKYVVYRVHTGNPWESWFCKETEEIGLIYKRYFWPVKYHTPLKIASDVMKEVNWIF